MHLYILTRGIKWSVDEFVNDMNAQPYEYMLKGKKMWAKLAMRPIQLWEVVFPKTALPNVMNTLWDKQPKHTLGREMLLNSMRISLNAKRIPTMDLSAGKRFVHKDFVAIYPVGIKEDNESEIDQEFWSKGDEML